MLSKFKSLSTPSKALIFITAAVLLGLAVWVGVDPVNDYEGFN